MTMKFVGCLVLLGTLLTACGKPRATTTDDYNQKLTEYYRKLSETYRVQTEEQRKQISSMVDTSFEVENKADEVNRDLVTLDIWIQQFSSVCNQAINAKTAAAFENVETTRTELLKNLGKLEVAMISSWVALLNNAQHVYADPVKAKAAINIQSGVFNQRGKQLEGIRALTNSYYELVQKNVPAAVVRPPVSQKRVAIAPTESLAASVKTGNGIAKDSTGRTTVLTGESEVLDFADRNGFSRTAVSAAYQMSRQTGGIITFSDQAKSIGDPITTILANVKAKINLNNDDLELVFAIDISGSMDDDIQGVIAGLVDITKSLQAVKNSGRGVKLGIVTFGAPGAEKVMLPMTSDLTEVAGMLSYILRNFNRLESSTNPGEASYHGLEAVAKQITWISKNRMVILITDEEAHELTSSGAGQVYVDGVMESLRQSGVQTNIYTIIAK